MAETRCGGCKHYAELKEPFRYEKDGYKDGITVFGFCGKNAPKTFSLYPVYLPDGGVCKNFVKKAKTRRSKDGKEVSSSSDHRDNL